jgi:hypothetical protein
LQSLDLPLDLDDFPIDFNFLLHYFLFRFALLSNFIILVHFFNALIADDDLLVTILEVKRQVMLIIHTSAFLALEEGALGLRFEILVYFKKVLHLFGYRIAIVSSLPNQN